MALVKRGGDKQKARERHQGELFLQHGHATSKVTQVLSHCEAAYGVNQLELKNHLIERVRRYTYFDPISSICWIMRSGVCSEGASSVLLMQDYTLAVQLT